MRSGCAARAAADLRTVFRQLPWVTRHFLILCRDRVQYPRKRTGSGLAISVSDGCASAATTEQDRRSEEASSDRREPPLQPWSNSQPAHARPCTCSLPAAALCWHRAKAALPHAPHQDLSRVRAAIVHIDEQLPLEAALEALPHLEWLGVTCGGGSALAGASMRHYGLGSCASNLQVARCPQHNTCLPLQLLGNQCSRSDCRPSCSSNSRLRGNPLSQQYSMRARHARPTRKHNDCKPITAQAPHPSACAAARARGRAPAHRCCAWPAAASRIWRGSARCCASGSCMRRTTGCATWPPWQVCAHVLCFACRPAGGSLIACAGLAAREW
jgi:hypothetical protein